jgi:hypothetical protein
MKILLGTLQWKKNEMWENNWISKLRNKSLRNPTKVDVDMKIKYIEVTTRHQNSIVRKVKLIKYKRNFKIREIEDIPC